jgi:predicted nucleotidyltransferase
MSIVSEILRRKSERKVRLQQALDQIVSQLKDLGALKIIVFGSFASGNVDVYSDLDLFVLMPSTKTGKEWSGIIEEVIDRNVATDIIVYNDNELHDMIPASRFLQNVMKGNMVYEKAA